MHVPSCALASRARATGAGHPTRGRSAHLRQCDLERANFLTMSAPVGAHSALVIWAAQVREREWSARTHTHTRASSRPLAPLSQPSSVARADRCASVAQTGHLPPRGARCSHARPLAFRLLLRRRFGRLFPRCIAPTATSVAPAPICTWRFFGPNSANRSGAARRNEHAPAAAQLLQALSSSSCSFGGGDLGAAGAECRRRCELQCKLQWEQRRQ